MSLFMEPSAGENGESTVGQSEEIRSYYYRKMAELRQRISAIPPQVKLHGSGELEGCQKADSFGNIARTNKQSKTTINIGTAFKRWCRLKEVKRLKSHTEVATFLLDRFDQTKHLTSRSIKKTRKRRLTAAPDRQSSVADVTMVTAASKIPAAPSSAPDHDETPVNRDSDGQEVPTLDPPAKTLSTETEGAVLPEAPQTSPLRLRRRPVPNYRTSGSDWTQTGTASTSDSEELSSGGSDSDWTGPVADDAEDGSSGDEEWGNKSTKSKEKKKPYQCKECGLDCPSQDAFDLHTTLCSGEKPFQCGSCDQTFGQVAHLFDHNNRVHLRVKSYRCNSCEMDFTSEKDFSVHRLTQHRPTYTIQHKSQDSSGPPIYQCQNCEQIFHKKREYSRHRKIHTGEKTFLCDNCGKAFKNLYYLTIHSRAHTGERPYQCELCGKAYTCKTALNSHRKKYHTGRKEGKLYPVEKPYMCEVCGKCYELKTTLVIHRKIHTGEKPYHCVQCGKAFKRKSHLSQHIRSMHTTYRPYHCNYCEKAFCDRGKLNVHLRIHTGEKPYQCGVCGRFFRAKYTLLLHSKTHTRDLRK